MDSTFKALIVKKFKHSELDLDIGRHWIVGTVVLRVSGSVERYEDQWILPTVSIPLIPVVAFFWERLGVERDAAMGVLREAIAEAMRANTDESPGIKSKMDDVAEAIPGMGLVATIDLGDPRDVHPRDKRPIGERLAAWSLADVYEKGGPGTGPLPVAASRVDGGRARVTFKATSGGLSTSDGQPPRQLEVVGKDGEFHPATGTIAGDAVVVEPAGESPAGGIMKIRHAWQPFPQPKTNLPGQTGLPATPFAIEIKP